MNIAIVGSRDYPLQKPILDLITRLPNDTKIVSGEARGVDSLAVFFAKRAGLECITIKAEWEKYGKSAGIRRNPDIVRASDEVHLFWDGKSKGTLNTL